MHKADKGGEVFKVIHTAFKAGNFSYAAAVVCDPIGNPVIRCFVIRVPCIFVKKKYVAFIKVYPSPIKLNSAAPLTTEQKLKIGQSEFSVYSAFFVIDTDGGNVKRH